MHFHDFVEQKFVVNSTTTSCSQFSLRFSIEGAAGERVPQYYTSTSTAYLHYVFVCRRLSANLGTAAHRASLCSLSREREGLDRESTLSSLYSTTVVSQYSNRRERNRERRARAKRKGTSSYLFGVRDISIIRYVRTADKETLDKKNITKTRELDQRTE